MRRALPILLAGAAWHGCLIHAAPAESNRVSVSNPASLKQPDKIDGAVLDGSGILWAYHREFRDHLYRFDGTAWSEQTAPFPKEGSTPLQLAKMTDGSISAFWRLKDNTVAVSNHTANVSTKLGVPTAELPKEGLVLAPPLADSKNRLWVTGRFPVILRVDVKEGWKAIHRITPEEMVNPDKLPTECSMIHAAEAGNGTVWIWSEQQWVRRANLQGVFLISDDKSELHREFQTTGGQKIDARNILSVAKADEGHLWVSVRYDGIYKVDVSTLKFARLADPEGQQLRIVQELNQVGGDLYAVVWVRDHAVLWRLSEGNWKQILPNIAGQHPGGSEFLRVPQGIVMYTSSEAPWFIPNEGDPVQLTWKYGFQLTSCRSMAYFPNGTLLAIGHNGDLFCGPFQLPPKEKGSSRVIEIRSQEQQPWVLDSEGTPWMISNDTPDILSRWSEGTWITIPIPGQKNESPRRARNILSDAQGRIWVLPPESSPQSKPLPLQVYDIHGETWRSFPSLQEAFLKIRPRPRFLANGHYLHGPEYSPDHRRIAFREETRTYQVDKIWRSESFRNFWYYDGSLWRNININEIIGTTDEHSHLGPPWFDKDGLLCVNVKDGRDMKKTWRMDSAGKWVPVPFESHFPDDVWSEKPNPSPSNRPPIPQGCVTDNPYSIVRDNHGVCWLTWQGGLYKAIPGKCVRVLRADEATPLKGRTYLREVYVDPAGNALINAAQHTMVAFIVKSKSPPPHTRLELSRTSDDSVCVGILASSKDDLQFRWQLDDQDWKTTKESRIDLKGLPNGKHTLRISATDAELQSDAVPATATFTIHVDPELQLARFIKQLSDPDYDRRKEAIIALAMQPAAAEPALLKARKKANEDLKWWIDATLQWMGSNRLPQT